MLMAIGAVVLYQVARKNGINSFEDLKKVTLKLTDELKEWVNVDKLKEALAPKEKLATV